MSLENQHGSDWEEKILIKKIKFKSFRAKLFRPDSNPRFISLGHCVILVKKQKIQFHLLPFVGKECIKIRPSSVETVSSPRRTVRVKYSTVIGCFGKKYLVFFCFFINFMFLNHSVHKITKKH